MYIDVHGHVTAPDKLYAYKAGLLAHRGAHGRGSAGLTKEKVDAALNEPNPSFGNVSHRQHLTDAGIDLQLISPRPYQMMHSESPAKLVAWFTVETNHAIALSCEVEPRFRGIAGLPQSMERGRFFPGAIRQGTTGSTSSPATRRPCSSSARFKLS